MFNFIIPVLLTTLTLNPNLTLKGEKVKEGEEAPFKGVILTPSSWFLLRSHFKEDKCKKAVQECSKGCEDQIKLILEQCSFEGTPGDDLVLKSLEFELAREQQNNKKLKKKNKLHFIASVSASFIAVSLATVLIFKHK